jgi:PH (Pleckstrin Homology) domain-containing protein
MPTNEPMAESIPQPATVMTSNVIIAPAAGQPVFEEVPAEAAGAHTSEAAGPGIEGEETVWEGHYSFKNFLGRALLGALLTLAWLMLAVYTWGFDHGNVTFWAVLLGIGLLAFWANLGYRFLRAHRGHHYRLTTRRLFVTTGFFRRRVDQLELLRIKDIYLQQSMIGDWLGVGNVVVISSEETLPKAYLLGIDEPRQVMDLIWHHMRIEQSQKTERISPV